MMSDGVIRKSGVVDRCKDSADRVVDELDGAQFCCQGMAELILGRSPQHHRIDIGFPTLGSDAAQVLRGALVTLMEGPGNRHRCRVVTAVVLEGWREGVVRVGEGHVEKQVP
jgi:hypothetical protein